jgi:hypothetical protein
MVDHIDFHASQASILFKVSRSRTDGYHLALQYPHFSMSVFGQDSFGLNNDEISEHAAARF